MVYDAEGESAMATSQDQREGELQVGHCFSLLPDIQMVVVVFCIGVSGDGDFGFGAKDILCTLSSWLSLCFVDLGDTCVDCCV